MLLQNLQAEFIESLRNNETLDIITPSHNLLIYRNNIISNFTSVLTSTYPLVVKLLGEDYFNGLVKEYIQQYPCGSDLENYGQYFADFILTIESLGKLPYLNEVATLEWLCHLAYYAAEMPEANLEILKSLSPDQYADLQLMLHPSCELKQFHYPILRIIDLCHGKMHEEIHLSEGGVNLLITRQNFEIRLIPLGIGEFRFLSAIKDNQSLDTALSEALASDPTFKLEEKLPLWIKEKTLGFN